MRVKNFRMCSATIPYSGTSCFLYKSKYKNRYYMLDRYDISTRRNVYKYQLLVLRPTVCIAFEGIMVK